MELLPAAMISQPSECVEHAQSGISPVSLTSLTVTDMFSSLASFMFSPVGLASAAGLEDFLYVISLQVECVEHAMKFAYNARKPESVVSKVL
jgi:hypothetical protein